MDVTDNLSEKDLLKEIDKERRMVAILTPFILISIFLSVLFLFEAILLLGMLIANIALFPLVKIANPDPFYMVKEVYDVFKTIFFSNKTHAIVSAVIITTSLLFLCTLMSFTLMHENLKTQYYTEKLFLIKLREASETPIANGLTFVINKNNLPSEFKFYWDEGSSIKYQDEDDKRSYEINIPNLVYDKILKEVKKSDALIKKVDEINKNEGKVDESKKSVFNMIFATIYKYLSDNNIELNHDDKSNTAIEEQNTDTCTTTPLVKILHSGGTNLSDRIYSDLETDNKNKMAVCLWEPKKPQTIFEHLASFTEGYVKKICPELVEYKYTP
jgi:hypothetical protein